MANTKCEECINYSYDMETDEYYCDYYDYMDQDEAGVLMNTNFSKCPMFRPGDEYTIVRKQI